MPNITSNGQYANTNANYGGPYMDEHVAAPLIRLSTPSAFNNNGAALTPGTNDVSGTAEATNKPKLSAQYTINSSAAQVDQGRMI
jgi:hypothetical protein